MGRLHQQKLTLGQIHCRCILTHLALNLRPLLPVRAELRPVRADLHPLRPMRPVYPEVRPLHPVRPELPGNACSNSLHLEPN